MMVEQCNSCDYNLFKLKADLEDDKKQLITFCIKHKLVLEQLQCRTCNKDCTLNYKKAVFRCQKTIYVTKNKQKKKKICCFEQSIWNNTFFSKSNLPTLTILHFVRSFLYGFKVEVTKHLLDISLQTISNWRSICREVCLHYQSQQLKILGQIGGKNMIVEIDKTCLGKQKHNVGTIDTYKDIWVFGGIERQSKRIFLELIEDKSAATLTNIIQKYIAPETTIFSDGWASNCKLSKLGFTHCVVNRKHKFVNAETGVHTQSIENLWKNLKRFRFDGSRNSMFPGYIATFFFKRNFPDEGERFHQFLLEAASLYNPSIPNPYRRRIKKSKCKDSNKLPPETSNLGTSSNFTAQSTPWEFIDVLKKEPGLQKDDGNKEITVKEEIPIKEEIEVEEETLFPPETTKDSFLTFEFENCSDFDNKPYAILPAIETDGRDSELVNGHKAINLNHIKEDPKRKVKYEQMLELLNTEDDILFDDENDPEYFSTTEQVEARISVVSDTESGEDEEPTPDNRPEKRAKLDQQTVWRKKLLENRNTLWKYDKNDSEGIQGLPNPYDLFKEYIPDSIMELFSEKTNQYAIYKDGQTLNTNPNEIEALLGMHMKMGTLGFPRVKMYWSAERGTRIPAIADVMPMDRFFKLQSYLHLVDINTTNETNDRLWKVSPIFDCVRERCRKVKKEEYYSIDEMMIPFTGQLNIKQYIKGKPNPWGVKLFLLCTSDGLCTDFFAYQGKTTAINEDLKIFGLGASVVLQLCKVLPPECNFKLALDNYFTSLSLIRHLKSRRIFCVGTIRSNRIEKCPLLTEKELSKKGRGSYDYRSDNDGVIVLRWYDNKAVTLASSFLDVGEETIVKRWDKVAQNFVKFRRPQIVKDYNLKMGGVDQLEQYISTYRICIRSRKWTLRAIFHMIDMAVCNCWGEYRKKARLLGIAPKSIPDLFSFRESITDGLLRAHKYQIDKSPNSSSSIPSRKPCVAPKTDPSTASRFDNIGHWPKFLDQKNASRCANKNCNKKSIIACLKCNKALCLKKERNCFVDYHNINEGTIKVSRKDKELPDSLNSDNLDEKDELIIPELHHRVSPRLPWPEEEESSGAEMDEDPLSIEIEDLEERNSLYHKAPSRTRSREQESTAHSFETHKKRTKIDN